ncbi:hypothetical protein TNCT_466551 [Trichonephila clavata]|uniref:Integrase catalytic domain-containing protein n=1 Tax=Trichonephila clavata TaxID=2740835 RepID=A0A8X6GLN5_TRICU|nr:hypothetical protein TNCT_466551 [Trichonephila clavata]
MLLPYKRLTLPLYALLLKFKKSNFWRIHFKVKGRGDFCPECAFSKASKFRLLAPGLHIWTKRSRSNGLAWIQYLITTTKKTVECLRDRLARFGLPRVLISDNGSQLTSYEFQRFMQRNGVSTKLVMDTQNAMLLL